MPKKNQDLGTPDQRNRFFLLCSRAATKYFRTSNPVDASGTVFWLTLGLKVPGGSRKLLDIVLPPYLQRVLAEIQPATVARREATGFLLLPRAATRLFVKKPGCFGSARQS